MLHHSPFAEPLGLSRSFDRVLGDHHAPGRTAPYPLLNAWEDADHIVVEAELPGLSMDDVEVTLTHDHLTIRGERPAVSPDDVRALQRERFAGVFERTIALPASVEADGVEATLHDGVLIVRMPKSDHSRRRRIDVKASRANPDAG